MTGIPYAKTLLAVFALIIIGGVALVTVDKPKVEVPTEIVVEPAILLPTMEQFVFGTSSEERTIEAYTFGDGDTHLLFVGGIHGGYEWNTVVLAYEVKDYLEANIEILPDNLTVTVVPSLNPDGVYKITGTEERFTATDIPVDAEIALGRFNGNNVDLNRNFGCKWQPESTWRGNVVSAGTEPFSEPEALAVKEFVLEKKPKAVVFWHSQGNAVFGAECTEGILPETMNVLNTYATAANYEAIPLFDAYPVTGDAEAWFASIGIPAITVELSTHEVIEFEKNLEGVKALLELYAL